MQTTTAAKERPILFSGEMVRAIHPKMNKWNESRKVEIDDQKIQELFDSGLTAKEIAPFFGCSTHPVKMALKRLGLSRKAARRPGAGSGEKNSAWKGGKRVRSDGYVMVWTPDGERLEHRVIMERHIGRSLTDSEVIHHRDGNKQNNAVDNLEVMTQSEHARHHAPEMHAARYGK